jgi:hypothetical protein
VFSLAEEMYARTARGSAPQRAYGPAPDTAPDTARKPGARGAAALAAWVRAAWARVGWCAAALLPGAACALALLGLLLTRAGARFAVASGGVLVTMTALQLALRTGPLRSGHRTGPATRAWTCVLLGYAVFGDGLLRAAVAGGGWGVLQGMRRAFDAFRAPTDGGGAAPRHAPTWPGVFADGVRGIWDASSWQSSGGPIAEAFRPLALAPVLALALAVVPAVCCARLFATGIARRAGRSRDVAEFTASARALLAAVCALFLWVLGVLLTLCAAVLHQGAGCAGAGALGALLMLARLLTVHGVTRAPAALLAAAGATEVLVLAVPCVARLPGCAWPAAHIEDAVGVLGPGIVPATACGAAALALLAHAARALTRASTHLPGPTRTASREASFRRTALQKT